MPDGSACAVGIPVPVGFKEDVAHCGDRVTHHSGAGRVRWSRPGSAHRSTPAGNPVPLRPPASCAPSRLDVKWTLPTPALINMANIQVEGTGGLGDGCRGRGCRGFGPAHPPCDDHGGGSRSGTCAGPDRNETADGRALVGWRWRRRPIEPPHRRRAAPDTSSACAGKHRQGSTVACGALRRSTSGS
jgi:hypothetical protein